MAGELGLKNSYRGLISIPLEQQRKESGRNPALNPNLGLIEFVQKHAGPDGIGLTNTQGKPVTWFDIWSDLGLDPINTTLDNLISLSDDIKYLAPEVVREFIVEGVRCDPWYEQLCAGQISVTSMDVTSPWIKYDDASLDETAEAETIAEADITWGSKTIKIQKRAKGLRLTDEVMLSSSLELLRTFLFRVGVEFAGAENGRAVATLINGDQSDASDSCAVIGIYDTSQGFRFRDFSPALDARKPDLLPVGPSGDQ